MEDRSITRLLVGVASLVIIIAGLKVTAGLLAPVLLSLFLVLVCTPIVSWLQQKRVPRWIAYVLVVLGVIAVGLLFITFLAVSIVQLTNALPTYRSLLEDQLAALQRQLDAFGLKGSDLLQLDVLQPNRVFELVVSFLSGLVNTLGNVGLTLFIFIYMLIGASSFSRKLRRGLGANHPMLDRIQSFSHSISTYLLIKSWLGAMTAIGHVVLLWVLGVDFAVLWGVLSFLFNFIPNIGYFIALIPPVLLALLQFGLVKALVVFIGYALINNFFDVAIGPRYLGKGLDLSTLVTFLAVIFWTWLLGSIGAFLALPLTVMLKKLLLEPFADTQLLAALMGQENGDDVIE